MRSSIALGVTALLFLLSASAGAQSHSSLEVAGLFAVAHRQHVASVLDGATEIGFGGRVGWHLNDAVRLEGEVSAFPREALDRGTRTCGLFGVVAGKRNGGVGVFAKARAGFLRFGNATLVRPGAATFAATNPALDLGGVFEAYRIRGMVVRFDAGDTIARIREIFCPYPRCPAAGNTWQHNFQMTSSVGWRF